MTASSQARDTTARKARAERILDIAGELLLRWGYKRLTVDDVAERAGIGKGTIYLHWKTREDLFHAVLRRELAAAADELSATVRADPGAVLLHRLTRANFLSVTRRPLLRAMVTADAEVLGKLARRRDERPENRHLSALDDYLRLLAAHGLLRDDLPTEDLRYAWHAIREGFFMAEVGRGERDLPEVEHTADLLAATVRAAFEPPAEPPLGVLTTLAPQVTALLTEIADYHRAILRRAYE